MMRLRYDPAENPVSGSKQNIYTQKKTCLLVKTGFTTSFLIFSRICTFLDYILISPHMFLLFREFIVHIILLIWWLAYQYEP